MGSIAFAQVSKKDDINKSVSRKVLNTDLKDLPADPEVNVEKGVIKGNSNQKMKGEESNFIKISDNTSHIIKGSSTQKDSGSKAAVPQTEDFTIKMSSSENKTIKTSGTQSEKSSADPYLKVTATKKE